MQIQPYTNCYIRHTVQFLRCGKFCIMYGHTKLSGALMNAASESASLQQCSSQSHVVTEGILPVLAYVVCVIPPMHSNHG
jgi:hypothetical protein